MSIINIGAIERTILGVNESSLFLNESNSSVTNTGIVERLIEASNDANFTPPLSDELISNNSFDSSNDWVLGSNWTILGGKAVYNNSGTSPIRQFIDFEIGKKYILNFKVSNFTTNYQFDVYTGQSLIAPLTTSSNEYISILFDGDGGTFLRFRGFTNGTGFSIDNVSVKEILVNRKSTVNNTGIVERFVQGINESDEMFPNNTSSNITNI